MNLDFNWIGGAITSLVTGYSGLFLAEGQNILRYVMIAVLVIAGCKIALIPGPWGIVEAFRVLAMYFVASTMLHYYNAPLPWSGSSLSSLLPDAAHTYANWIDQERLDILFQHIADLVKNLQHPSFADWAMIPVYWFVEIDMFLIEGILFAATALGFVALGIGALLGPLFIPWLLVPRLSWLFWNWLSFMLQYSFYRVVAAALTYVWASATIGFFDHAVNGNYSLAYWVALLPAMVVLTIALAWSIVKITSYTHDLFHGSSSAGGGFLGVLRGLL